MTNNAFYKALKAKTKFTILDKAVDLQHRAEHKEKQTTCGLR